MRRASRLILAVTVLTLLASFPRTARGEVPADGSYFIECRPTYRYKGTLVERWASPNAGEGTLHVFAPLLPLLPGQGDGTTSLIAPGYPSLHASTLQDMAIAPRRVLELQVDPANMPVRTGITMQFECKGTLYARSIRKGAPKEAVPPLKEAQRRRYLGSSTSIDFRADEFGRWVQSQQLKRRRSEDVTSFAHRVLVHMAETCTYKGDRVKAEALRPSAICRTRSGHCGALSALFVAVMRANDIPARMLIGRWATSEAGGNDQCHVMAEFFVDKSGWVPVEVSGIVQYKPKTLDRYFGVTNGEHIAFHVDLDFEPAKGFSYNAAQFLVPMWHGKGDFWKDQQHESKWIVVRTPIRPD